MNGLLALLCAMSLTAVIAHADSGNRAGRENPSALIAAIEERVELRQSTAGEFSQQKFISVLPQPLHSRGRFAYDPDSGLVWETLEPIVNTLEFDQQGIRQSVEGRTVWEIDAQQPAVATITRVISSVLAADWEDLQAFFSIEGAIDPAGWRLQLSPEDDVLGQVVSGIILEGDDNLSRMTLLEANGDRTEIQFHMHPAAQP